jgi:hypothetical protein
MKFPKIHQFRSAAKYANWAGIGRVDYRGTVKLHGTNGGVRFQKDGVIVAQSRNRDLTLESDNHGFAAFVRGQRSQFRTIHRQLLAHLGVDDEADREVTIFGEWVGPGIQRGVALAQLPVKQFVVFAAVVDDEFVQVGDGQWAIAGQQIHPITLAPHWQISLNFLDKDGIRKAFDNIQNIVDDVEARCPWAAMFGIDGVGEGIVWRPSSAVMQDMPGLWFKTKGAKHSKGGKRPKEPVSAPEGLEPFVAMACTDERLHQGLDYLREMGLECDMTSMGAYLKWVSGDICDELGDDMADAGLTWKQVAKHINSRAVAWFKAQTVVP